MKKPNESDSWYENHYSKVNITTREGSFTKNLFHNLLERNFKSNEKFQILEVGCNEGEHLAYVVKDFDVYTMTDIRKIKNPANQLSDKVNFIQAGVENLPFEDSFFDRVISTCVFHHVEDPEKGFKEVRRVLKNGGIFSLMLPNDPGLAYRTFRHLTSGMNARKLGISEESRLAHAREHRNHYLSLMIILKSVFQNDQVSVLHFPFGLPIYDLSLLSVVTVTMEKVTSKAVNPD